MGAAIAEYFRDRQLITAGKAEAQVDELQNNVDRNAAAQAARDAVKPVPDVGVRDPYDRG